MPLTTQWSARLRCQKSKENLLWNIVQPAAAVRVLTICCRLPLTRDLHHRDDDELTPESQKACKIYWTFWNVKLFERRKTSRVYITRMHFSLLLFSYIFSYIPPLSDQRRARKIFAKKKSERNDCLTVWTARRAERVALVGSRARERRRRLSSEEF